MHTHPQELPNQPSEATKKRLYGWDRNVNRKDLSHKLEARLAESQDKRRPDVKKDGGAGGGAKRGGGSGGSRR